MTEIINQNKQKSPFILALGTTYDLSISQYFVVMKNFAVPCGSSFIVALDTCLKSLTVFYDPPAVESQSPWMFLEHGIAGKPCPFPLPPPVQALIGQIMSRI